METDATESATVDDGWEWAIVEIFGHRRHVGRTREEERFGAKLLRIDIPVDGDAAANGWKTIYYSGGSTFSFALCSEAAAIQANKPYAPPRRLTYSAPDDPIGIEAGQEQDHADDDGG